MVANNSAPSSSSNVQNKSEYTKGFDNSLFFSTQNGFTIAFEDIIGGGDADWEDLVVNFRPTDGSGFSESAATPEPQTILLLDLGITGMAFMRRRKNEKKKEGNVMKRYSFLMVTLSVFLCSQAWAGSVMVQYVPAYIAFLFHLWMKCAKFI